MFFNNIRIFKHISNFINFSKHSYISYLFKMFYMIAKTKFENFLNLFKFSQIFLNYLKNFKIF